MELKSKGLLLRFDPQKLSGQVVQQASGSAWSFDLASANGVHTGTPEPTWTDRPWDQRNRAMEQLRPLRPSDLTGSRLTSNGLELDFRVAGALFRLELALAEAGADFTFTVRPLPGGEADLVAADLPGALLPANGDPIQVLACYKNQGRLFTGAAGSLEAKNASVRKLSMHDMRYRLRFFGVLGDRNKVGEARAGYVTILEENADALIVLNQAEDGRLSVHPQWLPSLGTLNYCRVARYRFQERPTVTSIAKEFRRYAQSAGLFKSLRQKIEERPLVEKMVGATACFIGYNASPLDYVGTFKRLREMGHERFYIFPFYHFNMGFEQIAGEKPIDIRAQAEALRATGGLLGSWTLLSGLPDKLRVHRLAARNPDGTFPLTWRINDDLWRLTCTRFACQELAGRTEELRQADVHHFDCTAADTLSECYSHAHPQERRQDRAFRIKMFEEATRLQRLAVSEGVKDWAVPHYDMGSNKEVPFAHETPAYRVIPLQHLVYHDALFSLWWEGDTYDSPEWNGGDLARQSLTDLLYGDMPLLFPVGRSYKWANKAWGNAILFDHSLELPLCAAAAQHAVGVAKHFKQVALEELTDFAWRSEDGSVQETHFGNGAFTMANFGSKPFELPRGKALGPLEAVSCDAQGKETRHSAPA